MARTKDYTAQNQKLFEAGLKKYAEQTIKPMLEAMLKNVADWMVAHISDQFAPTDAGGNQQFPVDTGNLHDATGVGVYIDGVLSSYTPTPIATQSQYTKGEAGIIGADRLSEALNGATSEFSTGIWIVLFSAVPYAYEVNIAGSPWERGVGYFNELENYLKEDVLLNLKAVKV